MKNENIPAEVKSKSLKEARDEINDILNKLESKDADLGSSIDDYKRLIQLNNHIDALFKKKVRGELTIVITEKNIKNGIFDESKIEKKAKKLLIKYSLRDVVELLYETEKINKKKIYQICLKLKNEKNY